jgi:hypothetical protein|tara:strand:+ start:2171 stop:2425 length:255 start_codon:yes stop_codon:yes gene_type:complete
MTDNYYIIYISVKNEERVLEDIPLASFGYEHEAKTYLSGYVDAIVNHTGEADEAKVRGQFTIRNVAGEVNVNVEENKPSSNKES